MIDMSETRALLMGLPESQLDPAMKLVIGKWNENPTALQVLEVLDNCVWAGLASGLVIQVLEVLLEQCITNQQTSYQDVVKEATWRRCK